MQPKKQGAKSIKLFRKIRKLGLSFLFLAVILHSIDASQIIEVISNLRFGTFFFIAITYFLGQMVSAVKWRMFLNYSGLQPSFIKTARAYMLGMFLNSFALGTVGGDVARALSVADTIDNKDINQTTKIPKQRGAAIATVLADRVHGLLVLTGLSIIAIDHFKANVAREIAFELAAASILALVVCWLIGPKILLSIFPVKSRFHEIAQKLSGAFPRKFSVIIPATLVSALFHVSQIMIFAVLAKELNLSLSLGYIFFFIPLINVACSLPLSFNGIGVRESLLIFFFTRVGVPAEAAFAIGAIWITVVTLTSAICGLVVSLAIARPELKPALNCSNSDSFGCDISNTAERVRSN